MSDGTTNTGMSDGTINTEYTIISIGTRRAAIFSNGRIVPLFMGGSEDDDKNGGDNDDGGGDNDNKDEFSPKQQKLVDDLIGKAFGKGMTKAEANNKEVLATLNAKITELEANKGKNDDKGKNEDLTALKAGLEAITKELSDTKAMAARESLKSISAELNAINSEQVAILIAPFIKYDGNKTSIVNSDGQARINSEGKEMTLTEFVKEFLGANPHLVKASSNNGSGSASAKGKGSNTANIEALRKLSPADRITKLREQKIN